MKICLIGPGSDLLAACESAVARIPGLSLLVTAGFDESCPAQFYIWDLSTSGEVPPELGRGDLMRHLIFAAGDMAEAVRTAAPGALVYPKPDSPAGIEGCLAELVGRAARSAASLNDPEAGRGFLARAAKELRAPLVALDGYCGLLLDQKVGGRLNATQADVVARMHHSIRRAARIADGVWTATAANAGDSCSLPLSQCVQRAIRDVAPAADAREFPLEADVDAALQDWNAPARLTEALAHVLDYLCRSAGSQSGFRIKAYPVVWRQGQVLAEGTSDEPANACRIDVIDPSAALPADEINGLLESSQAADTPGPAFLLAMALRIAAAHQGALWAANTGEGSAISLLLPCDAAPRSVAAAAGTVNADTFYQQLG